MIVQREGTQKNTENQFVNHFDTPFLCPQWQITSAGITPFVLPLSKRPIVLRQNK
jgi:hypothetical protein